MLMMGFCWTLSCVFVMVREGNLLVLEILKCSIIEGYCNLNNGNIIETFIN